MMKALVISILFSALTICGNDTCNLYAIEAVSAEYDASTNCTIYIDVNGEGWTDNNNYAIGQGVYLIMDSKGTDTILDDSIVTIMER